MTRSELIEDALTEMASQHRCGCGHPACKNCQRDEMCRAALAAPPDAQGGAPVQRECANADEVCGCRCHARGSKSCTVCGPVITSPPPAAPGTEAACPHSRGSQTEAEGYWIHRCLDCGAVNFNNEGWRGGRSPGQGEE